MRESGRKPYAAVGSMHVAVRLHHGRMGLRLHASGGAWHVLTYVSVHRAACLVLQKNTGGAP